MTHGRTNISVSEIKTNKYEQLVNYLMLYDSGDECTDITGGWTKTSLYNNSGYDGSVTKNTDNIYLYASSETNSSSTINKFACITTNSIIDVTEFKEIGIVCTQRTNTSNYSGRITCSLHSTTYVPSGFSQLNLTDTFGTYSNKTMKIGGYVEYHSNDANFYKLNNYPIKSGYMTVFQNYAGNSNVYNLFLLKADDWSTLCEKAGVTASSVTEAVAHAETILANASAVNFMVKNCTGDFMGCAISTESFMTTLESSPYKNKVYANQHWAKFLAMVA